EVNWLGDEPLENLAGHANEVLARVRSSGPLQQATLRSDSSGFKVELAHGEEGVSAGQACVFYTRGGGGERLLGGGWIKAAKGADVIPDRSRARQMLAGREPLAATPR